LVSYTSDSADLMPVTSESPYEGTYMGSRETPRILNEEGYMPSGGDDGWICPLDERTRDRSYRAYYYYNGGPGNPAEAPSASMISSYSANGVFRLWSPRSPWSFWAGAGQFVARYYSEAATPSHTIWFYDSGWSWDVTANSPWQLFYDWATLEYENWYNRSWPVYDQIRRHRPENRTPYGNMAFIDGHVEGGIDFAQTFDVTLPEGLATEDPLAISWWSFSGQ